MSKYIPGNQKHLTLEDRIYIQNELDKGTFLNAKSFCTRRFHCKKTNACEAPSLRCQVRLLSDL